MFRDRGDGWELLNAPDAIGAETPAGAQAKADAAAAAAEAAAKSYADSVVSEHANRTDNPHHVTASQVGAPTQAAFDAHLADTNNPHNVQAQQVPYSSGVSGFTPATVKAALDALAGVRIVEMGSNSNGTYVRWQNGLQVCWLTTEHTGTAGATGLVTNTWTYPAAFAALPTLAHMLLTPNPHVHHYSVGARTTTSAEYRVYIEQNPHSDNFTAHRIAIGGWK